MLHGFLHALLRGFFFLNGSIEQLFGIFFAHLVLRLLLLFFFLLFFVLLFFILLFFLLLFFVLVFVLRLILLLTLA